MGTDSYVIDQGNSSSSASYALSMTDTLSSSWHDAGGESLSDGDGVSAVTDNYTWNQFHSLTDNDNDSQTNTSYVDGVSVGVVTDTLTGAGVESFSTAEVGNDTLSADPSDSNCLTLSGGSDNYTINELTADGATLDDSVGTSVTATSVGNDSLSYIETGWDSHSGSSNLSSESYSIEDYYYLEIPWSGTWPSDTFDDSPWTDGEGEVLESYSLQANGTDSLGPDNMTQSTFSYNDQKLLTSTFTDIESINYNDGYVFDSYVFEVDCPQTSSLTVQDNGTYSYSDGAMTIPMSRSVNRWTHIPLWGSSMKLLFLVVEILQSTTLTT